VNAGSNSVSVIDTVHDVSAGTIAVGQQPGDIAVTRDGAVVVVTNSGSDSVSIIDGASHNVVAEISVGDFPNQVVLAPNGTRAYVTDLNSGEISVIDLAARQVEHTIDMGRSAGPYSIAITRQGQRIYVGTALSRLIYVFDTSTFELVQRAGLSIDPHNIAVRRDEERLYASTDFNIGMHTYSLVRIDRYGDFVELRAPYACSTDSAGGITIAPDGHTGYVACGSDNRTGEVDVIDLGTTAITGQIPVGRRPTGVAVSADGTKVYVTNANDDTVSVIDRATNTVVQVIAVGNRPTSVAAAGPIFRPTPTATEAATPTPKSTQTATEVPTASHTPAPSLCVGDCDGGGTVTVDELVVMVNIALGDAPISACPGDDQWCNRGDPTVGMVVTCIIEGANNSFEGCSELTPPLSRATVFRSHQPHR